MKARVTTAIGIAFLLATGTAVAASGVGSMIVGGDDGATANSAQQIGLLSATAPTTIGGKSIPGDTNTPGGAVQGTSQEDGVVKGTLHVRGGNAPYTGRGPGGGSGGSGGRLPFTGLMAIPLIGFGLALIGSGLFLRRRKIGRA